LNTADVIDTWVYRQGLARLQFSLAAAIGLIQSVIGMVLILGSNYIAKKISGRGIF